MMATVRTLAIKDLESSRGQADVEATIGVLTLDGEKYVQIDTYGSKDRKYLGKTSQTIRLSREAFDELIAVGSKFFGAK